MKPYVHDPEFQSYINQKCLSIPKSVVFSATSCTRKIRKFRRLKRNLTLKLDYGSKLKFMKRNRKPKFVPCDLL